MSGRSSRSLRGHGSSRRGRRASGHGMSPVASPYHPMGAQRRTQGDEAPQEQAPGLQRGASFRERLSHAVDAAVDTWTSPGESLNRPEADPRMRPLTNMSREELLELALTHGMVFESTTPDQTIAALIMDHFTLDHPHMAAQVGAVQYGSDAPFTQRPSLPSGFESLAEAHYPAPASPSRAPHHGHGHGHGHGRAPAGGAGGGAGAGTAAAASGSASPNTVLQMNPMQAARKRLAVDSEAGIQMSTPQRKLLGPAREAMSPRTAAVKQWRPPNPHATRAYIARHHPRLKHAETGQLKPFPVVGTRTGRHCWHCCKRLDPFGEGVDSMFTELGAGITLYFKYLKYLVGVFAIMSVMYTPAILLNTFGPSPDTALEELALSSTTLGNLGDFTNVTRVFIPSTQCGESRCSVGKDEVATLYGWMDLLASVAFLIGYLWLRFFERREAQIVDRYNVSVSDYSVHVTGLPTDCTEADVLTHFERVAGGQVAEVSLAKDCSKLVRLFMERGKTLKRLEVVEDRIALHQATSRPTAKLVKLHARLMETVDRIRRLQHRVSPEDRVLGAFVTFEEEASMHACLKRYPDAPIHRLFQHEVLRFKGKRALRVTPAPDPSTLLWENLGTPLGEALCRRLVTALASLLLVAGSFALLVWASYRQKEAKEAGGVTPCPEEPVTLEQAQENEEILYCYCETLPSAVAASEPVCKSWLADKALALALAMAASFSVVAVNALLNILMKRLTAFEKHDSMDDREKSLARRLFAVQFVNTGIVVLLANAYVTNTEFGGQRYRDFETGWYLTVGGSIILTMLLNTVSPHVAPLARTLKLKCKRKCSKPVSQRQMNELYTGLDFHLSIRYAQVTNVVFVTMMYSAGIPLLVPIAMVMFSLAYWVDKTLLLRMYRTPPLFNEGLGRGMSGLLPYALVLHLGFAVWMLGNTHIFSERSWTFADISSATDAAGGVVHDDSASTRIRQRHVTPLFLLFVAMIVVIVLTKTVRRVKTWLLKALSCLMCGLFVADDRLDLEFRRKHPRPPYSRAMLEGTLRGLTSYNILKNPRFASAFAITASFADRHNTVRAVVHSELPQDQRQETKDSPAA